MVCIKVVGCLTSQQECIEDFSGEVSNIQHDTHMTATPAHQTNKHRSPHRATGYPHLPKDTSPFPVYLNLAQTQGDTTHHDGVEDEVGSPERVAGHEP